MSEAPVQGTATFLCESMDSVCVVRAPVEVRRASMTRPSTTTQRSCLAGDLVAPASEDAQWEGRTRPT